MATTMAVLVEKNGKQIPATLENRDGRYLIEWTETVETRGFFGFAKKTQSKFELPVSQDQVERLQRIYQSKSPHLFVTDVAPHFTRAVDTLRPPLYTSGGYYEGAAGFRLPIAGSKEYSPTEGMRSVNAAHLAQTNTHLYDNGTNLYYPIQVVTHTEATGQMLFLFQSDIDRIMNGAETAPLYFLEGKAESTGPGARRVSDGKIQPQRISVDPNVQMRATLSRLDSYPVFALPPALRQASPEAKRAAISQLLAEIALKDLRGQNSPAQTLYNASLACRLIYQKMALP